jgi:hypothetical protein
MFIFYSVNAEFVVNVMRILPFYAELLGVWTFSIVRCSWEWKHDVSETGPVSVIR